MANRVRFWEDDWDDETESLARSGKKVTYEQPQQPQPEAAKWSPTPFQPQPQTNIGSINNAQPKQSGMPSWLTKLLTSVATAGVASQNRLPYQTQNPFNQMLPALQTTAQNQIKRSYVNPYTGKTLAQQQPNMVIPTGQTGTRAQPRVPFGAELDSGNGGWTPQQIATASQTDLRKFYALEPEERYWLARAITKDNPRLYGKSRINEVPFQVETGYNGYGSGYASRGYPSGGGGGGGYTYKEKPPEWYLNMVSWGGF